MQLAVTITKRFSPWVGFCHSKKNTKKNTKKKTTTHVSSVVKGLADFTLVSIVAVFGIATYHMCIAYIVPLSPLERHPRMPWLWLMT